MNLSLSTKYSTIQAIHEAHRHFAEKRVTHDEKHGSYTQIVLRA